MHCRNCFMLFALSFLFLARTVVAFLPYGCGGTVGILSITAPGFDSLVWTCSGIIPVEGFLGAINMTSSWSEPSLSDCGNKCASYWYKLPNIPYYLADTGALYFPNSTCQCLWLGDDTGDLVASKDGSESATYIDFYNGFGAPSQAQDWGVFTCPEGASSSLIEGNPSWGECSSLSVTPAEPPIAFGGYIGGECGSFCATNYNAEYAVIVDYGNCYCYDDLKGLKYEFNLTGLDAVVDLYDPRPTTIPTISSIATSSKASSTLKTSSKLKPSSTLKSSSTVKSSSTLKTSSTIKTSSTTKTSSTIKTFSTLKTSSTLKSSSTSYSFTKSISRTSTTKYSTSTSTSSKS